jgi:hypothetical protein
VTDPQRPPEEMVHMVETMRRTSLTSSLKALSACIDYRLGGEKAGTGQATQQSYLNRPHYFSK